jgi:hypothetical protein
LTTLFHVTVVGEHPYELFECAVESNQVPVAPVVDFNDDGFDSSAPKYSGGRPPTFELPQRREIKKIVVSRLTAHDLPFSTWSLSKLA